MKCHQAEEDEAWARTAWMVAYLLQPHTKRHITPDRLLSWRKRPTRSETPRTEKWNRLWDKLQRQRNGKVDDVTEPR